MDSDWINLEERLWRDFMNPPRRKISMHSMLPDDKGKTRLVIDQQKEREFLREWEAYDKWIHH